MKNILFIMADQFRFDALACNGNEVIKTPNFDRLAALGVNFTNAFTPNPICVPGRASIITGCYSHKCIGKKVNSGTIKGNYIKMPQYFKENGYKTYSIGKLHYLPYMPPGEKRTTHGFDTVELCESGRMLKQFSPEGKIKGIEDYFDYLETVGWKGFTRANGMGNNDIYPTTTPVPEEHYVDSWVATRSIHHLKEHQKNHKDTPFFFNVSFPKPHSAYDPPEPWNRMYDPRTIPLPAADAELLKANGRFDLVKIQKSHMWNLLSNEARQTIIAHYYGLISLQDKQIGRILDYLEESGILSDTIIVFTADHGDMMGDFGLYFKSNMYNGSVRIPLIIVAPGNLAKNETCEIPVTLCDLFPTLVGMAELNFKNKVDGVDIAKLMDGREKREYVISYTGDAPHQQYMICDGEWKYTYAQSGAIEELYNQKNDIKELCNEAVNHAEIVAKMRRRIIEWCTENQDGSMIYNGNLALSEPVEKEFKRHDNEFGRRHY